MSARFIIGSSVLVAAAITGCGESTSQPRTVVTVIERTVTAPAAPVADHAAASHAAATASAAPTVPDVTGQRLDVAELHLRAKHLRYREVGGGALGILVRANWTVCEQEPGAGGTTHGRVSLIVDRECE